MRIKRDKELTRLVETFLEKKVDYVYDESDNFMTFFSGRKAMYICKGSFERPFASVIKFFELKEDRYTSEWKSSQAKGTEVYTKGPCFVFEERRPSRKVVRRIKKLHFI